MQENKKKDNSARYGIGGLSLLQLMAILGTLGLVIALLGRWWLSNQ
jgi:hypothetical protein